MVRVYICDAGIAVGRWSPSVIGLKNCSRYDMGNVCVFDYLPGEKHECLGICLLYLQGQNNNNRVRMA